MLRRTKRSLHGLCFVFGLAAALPRTAYADPVASEEARVNEAKQLFSRGSELFLAKRYAEALDALDASYKLVPSPNSGLLIARCLRALSKPVQALEMFTTVESEARRRVASGEAKYGITAASAAVESAELRAGLGSLRIRVDPPIAGAMVAVDGTTCPLDADGVAVVWRVPGEARVTLQRPGAAEQKQVSSVPAGGEAQMEFGSPGSPPGAIPPVVVPLPPASLPPPLPVAPRPTSKDATSAGSWAKPAAWIAGAMTVSSFGLFAGFGVASHNEYNDLRADCPHGCGMLLRAEAQLGETNQSIANVALVVGSVAAACTLTFVVIALSSSPSSTRAGATPQVTLGLGSAGLYVPW